MNKIVVDLPRIYKKGNPPRILLDTVNLQEIGVDFPLINSPETAHAVLSKLYVNKHMSLRQLGELFGVQSQTVNRWLKRLAIPIRNNYDSVSLSLSKHKRTSFSGNKLEAAYMLGLRYGDISAQQHGRNIRLSVTTNHPALLNLFEETFNKYGKIGKYPKHSKNRHFWSTYCDVDNSFDFLLKKSDIIPQWITDDHEVFLSFLAGYFDAEGCICISYGSKKYSTMQWIIKTYDKQILAKIREVLSSIGIDLNLKLAKPADGILYNQDYWSIETGMRSQVSELIRLVPIRHSEKLLKAALVERLLKDSIDGKNKVSDLRSQIKRDVLNCMKSAELAYNESH